MNLCHGCGGVIGRDCFNPRECEEITRSLADDALYRQPDQIRMLEEQVNQFKAQRDELLEALKKIYEITTVAEPSGLIDEIWSISKEAIEN